MREKLSLVIAKDGPDRLGFLAIQSVPDSGGPLTLRDEDGLGVFSTEWHPVDDAPIGTVDADDHDSYWSITMPVIKRGKAILEMARAITESSDTTLFISGDHEIGRVIRAAREWVDAGFTARTAAPWWEHGGFDPDRCSVLRDRGVQPSRTNMDAIYAVCNGDAPPDSVPTE